MGFKFRETFFDNRIVTEIEDWAYFNTLSVVEVFSRRPKLLEANLWSSYKGRTVDALA